jgi:hypothetical protein
LPDEDQGEQHPREGSQTDISNSGADTSGEIVGRLPMLEVACSDCARRGRSRVAKLIQRHRADTRLPAIRIAGNGDLCSAPGAVGRLCSDSGDQARVRNDTVRSRCASSAGKGGRFTPCCH